MRSFFLAAIMILAVAGTAAAEDLNDFVRSVSAGCELLRTRDVNQMYSFLPAMNGEERVLFAAKCESFDANMGAKYGKVSFSTSTVNGYGQNKTLSPVNYCMNMREFERQLNVDDIVRLRLLISDAILVESVNRYSTHSFARAMEDLPNNKMNWQWASDISLSQASLGFSGLPIQRFVANVTANDFVRAKAELAAAGPALDDIGKFCRAWTAGPAAAGPKVFTFSSIPAPADDQAAEIKRLKAENAALKKAKKK